MNRKLTLLTLCSLLLALCSSVEAQQAGKIPVVGVLSPSSATFAANRYETFRQALRALGYIEGKNLSLAIRYADGKQDRLFDFATELVKLKVDVIVTSTAPGVLAAKKATSMIPILFVGAADPMKSGIVSSLAQPGGNVTGLSIFGPELDGKRLELLKETSPNITRIAHLWMPSTGAGGVQEMQAAAPVLGVQVQSVEVRNAADFDGGFAAILSKRAQAVTVGATPLLSIHRQRIVDFAAKHRLPGIYPSSEFVDAGGLMFYGVSFSDLYRRAATYVDKILKGTKAADLPVEQPMKFDFVINLKTAKQIGLTIPPNLLARADRVIR